MSLPLGVRRNFITFQFGNRGYLLPNMSNVKRVSRISVAHWRPCGYTWETIHRELLLSGHYLANGDSRAVALRSNANWDRLVFVLFWIHVAAVIAYRHNEEWIAAVDTFSQALIVLGCLFPLYFAIYISRNLRKFRLLPAKELLAADNREPVLYLRSFGDDQRTIRAGLGGSATKLYAIRFRPFMWRVNMEEELATESSRLGPFLAIHRAGEHLRNLGASRAVLADDEWQTHATDWIQRSAMIVMLVGTTPSVKWELRYIKEKGLLRKTIFLFPPAYGSFWGEPFQVARKRAWRALKEELGFKDECDAMFSWDVMLGIIGGDDTLNLIHGGHFMPQKCTFEDYSRSIRLASFVSICLNRHGDLSRAACADSSAVCPCFPRLPFLRDDDPESR